jgi:hypothetical protein
MRLLVAVSLADWSRVCCTHDRHLDEGINMTEDQLKVYRSNIQNTGGR